MLEARAFEPEFLNRLDRLILGVKRARTSRIGPRTVGRVQGIGIEIENFRDYVAGDDLRFLDWNAVGRLDQLYVRTYRAEREIELSVLIDTSASMGAPPADDKLGLALALAAAIAYVGMSESDAVRLVAFGLRRGKLALTPTAFHRRRESYAGLRPFVTGVRCGGETRLAAAVEQLLAARRQPGLTVLISDFLVNATDYEDALSRLLAARHEVKVMHVMGERESRGALAPGLYRLRDSESGQLRDFSASAATAEACRRRVAQLAARLRDFCSQHGVMYLPAFGAGNLEEIINGEFPRLGVIR